MKALQDEYAPNNMCFGCGAKNQQGLQIKSIPHKDKLIAYFKPKNHHQAFEGVLSGGICGTLLDCHSNWCAAYFIMGHRKEPTPPCTVTAHFAVDLLLPTPMDQQLTIVATPKIITQKKAEISAEIFAGEKCTAKCEGLFVAVSPGHPAYHRW